MDRLQSLRVFRKVAEEGGFAAAARKMDLDPAMATRLVADLERHLGAALFQRTTRRVSLTPAGEEYLASVRSILAELDEADAGVRRQSTALGGKLRILSSALVAANVLAPALKGFLSKYPDIQLDIRNTQDLEPPLEDYDLTFLGAHTPLPSDIVVRELTATTVELYASPAYLRRYGVPRKPADLAAHRNLRLRLPGESAGRLRFIHPAQAHLEETLDIRPALVAESGGIVLRAVLDGLGITGLPRAVAAPHVASGTLRPVLPPWITNRVPVLAAYPSRKFLSARARVFLDHVIRGLEGRQAAPKRSAKPPAGA
jgi:DNA-binding transcriptional LysR family regulator